MSISLQKKLDKQEIFFPSISTILDGNYLSFEEFQKQPPLIVAPAKIYILRC